MTTSFLLTPLAEPPPAAAALGDAAALKLLHAERDALLLDIDVEHDRLHHLALAVEVERVLARHAPGDVRHVDHAVDVAVEADEQAELGRVLDLALDLGADRMGLGEGLPRIGLRLLEAERNAALLLVDLEHRRRRLPARWRRSCPDGRSSWSSSSRRRGPGPRCPASSSTKAPYSVMLVTRPLNTPSTGYLAAAPSHGSLSSCFMPRLDALRLAVDADDLHLHRLADVEHLGRMADALVGDVGDVEQAVDAAEIDEGAVIGDVLDDAVDAPGPRRATGSGRERCSARVSSRMARRETTILPRRRSIFRIWNGCGRSISGPTSRTGRISTWLNRAGRRRRRRDRR